MRGWRWLAVLVMVATVLAPSLAAPVRAQYATGLPNGVVALEVDGQPIDAANTPETGSATPQINGRVNTGQPVIGIGIGAANGDILRFDLEVDQRGRFKGQPPEPLAPGEYGLYLDDVLAGAFSVTGDGAGDAGDRDRDRKRSSTADLARAVPVPADFGGLYPGLGLLNGRYYSLEEEAVRSAAARGDVSDESIDGVRQSLRDAGWLQRYEARLASPDPENPDRFAIQVTTFVIEYETPEQAFAAFQTSVTGTDLRPDVAVGEISELAPLTGTTPDTGVEYRGLRNLFLQGRFVGAVILADLLGGEPNQDVVLGVSQLVAARTAMLEGGSPGASPRTLRLNLPADAEVTVDEVYEAVDGAIVPLYNEDERGRAAREAMFAGTYEDFVGSAAGSIGGRDRARDGTPTPSDAGRAFTFAYGSTVMLFPTPEDADAWLAALPDRIANDPLRGYADFQPAADAPAFGDASSTWAVTRVSPDGPLDGFKVYLRVGADIAALEYAASQAPELADLQPLIDAQLACLAEGACPADGSLPARGDRERDRDGGTDAGAATPEPSGPGVSIVDGNAPAAETPAPGAAAETPPPAAEPAEPGVETPEPAIRRTSGATSTPEPQPEPAPTEAPAEEPTAPAPSGGVRIITPEPEVTGG